MYLIGNQPPAMVPAKGAYMAKDIQRLRDFYGIPIVEPSVSIDLDFQTDGGGVGARLNFKP